MRTMARTRSSSVESASASTPARLKATVHFRLAPAGRLLEAAPEARVVGVDIELLAGLGVLHDQRADIGQLNLARVGKADGDDLVTSIQQTQRSFPTGNADEVRDDEDQRAALGRQRGGVEQRRQVGKRRTGQARLPEQVVDQPQDLVASAASRMVRSSELS